VTRFVVTHKVAVISLQRGCEIILDDHLKVIDRVEPVNPRTTRLLLTDGTRTVVHRQTRVHLVDPHAIIIPLEDKP
jgi:hypothetical protein